MRFQNNRGLKRHRIDRYHVWRFSLLLLWLFLNNYPILLCLINIFSVSLIAKTNYIQRKRYSNTAI